MTAFPKDGPLKEYYDNCYGYAVFEKAGKGAFIVGLGGSGGDVFVKDDGDFKQAGKATLVTASAGWSIGIEVYSEIIFFQTKEAFDKCSSGKFDVGCVGSAAIVKGSEMAATGTNVGYKDGLAVFITGSLGLMLDASLEGQTYTFKAA